MNALAVVVMTYNEAAHIEACLASVAFAPLRVVWDSFSTDDTVARARAVGAEVQQRAFDNFAAQRNAALDALQGRARWVLFVDADERVTPELAQAVQQVVAQDDNAVAGYRIPRHNHIFGKVTRGAGWYPDYQTRLLRVGRARYDPTRKVHEVVILDGEEGTLAAHFTHYNYQSVAQFHAKQRKYTAYDAQILYEQGVRPKPHNFILQPLRHFRWRYVTLKGYREGWHGLRLCAFMAWYEWRKYALLARLWRENING